MAVVSAEQPRRFVPVSERRALRLARQFRNAPSGYNVDIAQMRDELSMASADFAWAMGLVHDVYVNEGYIKPRPSGLYLNLFLLLPQSRTFVVKENRVVIGTLSVVIDSPLGLPADQFYPSEMEELRHAASTPPDEAALLSHFFCDLAKRDAPPPCVVGSHVAEITAFALDENYQACFGASASNLCLHLMRMAYRYSVMAGVSTYIIEVTPKHAQFYEQFWGFKTFATGAVFPVDGAPVVAMRGHPFELTKELTAAFARLTAANHGRGMHPLLALQARERVALSRSLRLPVLTPASLRYFIETQFHPDEPSLWDQASDAERLAFQSAYAPYEYDFSWAGRSSALEREELRQFEVYDWPLQ